MTLQRTRIKICGITRPDDGVAAARAGADAIGLVFWARSSRAVAIEQAVAICRALPPFVATVGLFVDADPAWVEEVLNEVPLSLLQFHGEEAPDYCEQFGVPYLKAVRMRDDVDTLALRERYASAQALLLDTYRAGVPGGTGAVFDWNRVPSQLAPQIVLAGGLTSDNVGAAVQRLRPWAVDTSGGVESAPGIKDAARIAAFIAAVRVADSQSI
jgi:phosphoribosylanthranilate isomerase